MNNFNLSTPWDIYAKRLIAMFKGDPDLDIIVNFNDEKEKLITFYVKNGDMKKGNALGDILPEKIDFGNVVLKTKIQVSNKFTVVDYAKSFKKAFKSNPHVAKIKTVTLPTGEEVTYVIFKKEVIQYYSDDLLKYDGITSILLEDIARDIFPGGFRSSILFSTEFDEMED